MNLKERYRVDIMEYAKGWGQNLYDVKFFDDKEQADKFIKDYNTQNMAPFASNYYSQAKGPYKVMVDA